MNEKKDFFFDGRLCNVYKNDFFFCHKAHDEMGALSGRKLLLGAPRLYRAKSKFGNMRDGTLIVATIYLQLTQNRYLFRSFTVLQCSHQHCVQPVASDVEVVGYL